MIRPIIITLTCLSLFSFCKKKNTKTSSDSGALRPYYTDTLVSTEYYNAGLFVTSSPKFLYILQKNVGSSHQLLKSDLDANLIYQRSLPLDNDLLIDICGSKVSDDFYTLTATDNYEYKTSGVTQAYLLKARYSDSSVCYGVNIAYNYEFDSGFEFGFEIRNSNHSHLKKFNSEGKEVWSKTLDGNYFSGNAIETDTEGNTYVLTATRHPYTPKLTKELSSLIPYYDLTTDSNSISLYKFDIEGTLLFKKSVSGFLGDDYANFHPSLAVSSLAIYVKNRHHFFTFKLNGAIIGRTKPLKNVCYNYLSSIIANPNLPAAFVKGVISTNSNNHNTYFLRQVYTTGNNVINNLNISSALIAMDGKYNIYAGSGAFLTKRTSFGEEIYNKNSGVSQNGFFINEHNTLVDCNNNFYCFVLQENLIFVYKFDEAGNYY